MSLLERQCMLNEDTFSQNRSVLQGFYSGTYDIEMDKMKNKVTQLQELQQQSSGEIRRLYSSIKKIQEEHRDQAKSHTDNLAHLVKQQMKLLDTLSAIARLNPEISKVHSSFQKVCDKMENELDELDQATDDASNSENQVYYKLEFNMGKVLLHSFISYLIIDFN